MICKLIPYDPTHFATQLHLLESDQRLDWAISSGQSVLLIRTPFYQVVDNSLDKLCDALNKKDVMPTQYTELAPDMPDVWIRAVSASEKAKMGGCTLLDKPATYTVIAYDQKDEEVFLYMPQANTMNKHFCHVSFSVEIMVRRVMQEAKRLFRSNEFYETPFYMISFPNSIADLYHDGDIYYEIDHLVIPITKDMIKNGAVYIQSGETKPVIKTQNPGMKLTIK